MTENNFIELDIFLIDTSQQDLGLTPDDIPAKAFINLSSIIAVRETMRKDECCIYLNNDQTFIIKTSYKMFVNIIKNVHGLPR